MRLINGPVLILNQGRDTTGKGTGRFLYCRTQERIVVSSDIHGALKKFDWNLNGVLIGTLFAMEG